MTYGSVTWSTTKYFGKQTSNNPKSDGTTMLKISLCDKVRSKAIRKQNGVTDIIVR